MAVVDYFLTPLGFAALAAAIPLVLLYLFRPEPARYELPTIRFLLDESEEDSRHAVLDRLRQDLLLLVQLLVLLLVATALASPYVSVAEEATIDEAIIVVDASASMATEAGAGTRFDAAIGRARDAVAGTTSIVTVGGSPTVALRNAPRAAAERRLDGLTVTHAPGDLGGGVTAATSVAGEDARLVVVSDFADEGWRDAVAAARARGYRVDLEQVAGGGAGNVGIVEAAIRERDVTVTVRNYGTAAVTRTVRLGDAAERVEVGGGDVAAVTLPIPAGGGEVRVTPGDAFPVDDELPVVAPPDPSIDVLLVTNDRNRFLATALSLIDAVELDTAEPPTTIRERYDVIVFSNVEADRVLPGNVETARGVVAAGGGVAIQAQPDVGAVGYRNLLLVEPDGLANGSTTTVTADPLTRDISFPPPDRYVRGSLRSGRALVRAGDGSPLVAVEERAAGGAVLYYGFIEAASAFKYNYRYPVFWKRAIHVLSGRPSIAALNRRTGTTWRFDGETTVAAPDGSRSGTTIALDRVGVYEAGARRVGAGLLDAAESNVTAPAIAAGGDGVSGGGTGTEERRVPRELAWVMAAAALLVVLGELVVLRRRGDL